MLSVYRNMFRIRDLRNKVLFTLMIIAVYRLGAAIPVPGVDIERSTFADQAQAKGIVGSSTCFRRSAGDLLGAGSCPTSPSTSYKAAGDPRLQKLREEGEAGRKSSPVDPYVTVVLALLQSTGLTYLFIMAPSPAASLITLPRTGAIIVITTAGTAFIVWLGELISQRGIGNGMS
jgi:preprotein translocase subunit SecY